MIHANAPNRYDEQADPLGKRVLIGRLIKQGIEPPVFLERDIVIDGSLHWLYGDSESGKTWLALWLVKRRIEAGQRALYLDQENGPEVIGERLEILGCNPETIDRYLGYYEEPDLQLDPKSVKRILERIKEINPALTVFDSTRGFLTAAGLEESSNDDLDKLYALLLKPIRSAKRTAVVLDHIGHGGNHARGAKRKRDMCDVMFEVSSTGFDESKLGEIRLTRRKGRRGHVPERITFSAGGGEKGFVFERSAGTITDLESLTEKDCQALEFIVAGGANGVSYKSLLGHMGGKKSTVSDSTNKLIGMNLIRRDNGRYYSNGSPEPENRTDKRQTNGSERFGSGSDEPAEPGEPAARGVGSDGSVFLGTEPSEPARPGLENGGGIASGDKASFSGKRNSQQKSIGEGKDGGVVVELPRGNLSSSLAVVPNGALPHSENDEVVRMLDDPPEWLRRQMQQCREEPDRFLTPTSATIAYEMYSNPRRADEVLPILKAYVGKRANAVTP
jgi:archaellum biogenesis ATPase FlaH